MKTVAGILLAVLLAAAIIFGFVIHGKYSDTREALLLSEKNSFALNEKVAQLTEEVSSLNEKLREQEGVLTELESAQTGISKLEDALGVRDRRIGELQEELSLVRGDLENKRKAEAALREKLNARKTLTAELQEELRVYESRSLSLEQENARQQNRIDELRDRLSDLEGEKASVESEVDRLQATYEALIADLKEQIEKREVTIEAFEERISVSFLDRILFDFGKETITPEGREVLEKVGGILKDVQDKRIRVIGTPMTCQFCLNIGTDFRRTGNSPGPGPQQWCVISKKEPVSIREILK